MAKEASLDLVEVASDAKPTVCRIMDYNKIQYDKRRKAKESKKKAKQTQLKEVKFRPTIDPHDLQTKVKKVRKFLERGDKVKLTLMFRGRQIVHSELGRKVLEKVIQYVEDVGQIEGGIQRQGRFMGALLIARPDTGKKKKLAAEENSQDEKTE
jgi:translation initiation factor IF-3